MNDRFSDKAVPVRRVGTVSAGLALIASGILLLLWLLGCIDAHGLLLAARFAPVLLIILGAEFLFAGTSVKQADIRYDFLGALCALLVIGAALLAAALALHFRCKAGLPL